MTKGGRLIWDLFMWLREVMPSTPENTKRQTEWAARFHEMEQPDEPVVTGPGEAATTADHDADVDAHELEAHEDDTPPPRRPPRKKR